MVNTRAAAALLLGALGFGPALAANCTEAEASSVSAAYAAFQDSVSADCSAEQCAQACVDTQQLLSTALPDCEYVDGANYHAQVLSHIANCSATDAPTIAPAAATDATPAPGVVAPAAVAATATTDGSGALVAACTSEQGDSILAAYSAYQVNMSVACASDKCASDCVAVQTDVAALLPDCQYTDGVNYHEQVATALSACGAGAVDAGYAPSTLPCSLTQSNVTIILYSQYESELREACDADKCSSVCIGIVNQLAAVLPDCVYSDGVNYHNESIGIIDACAITTSSSSSSGDGSAGFGPDSAASSIAVSPLPALLGLLAVLAACL